MTKLVRSVSMLMLSLTAMSASATLQGVTAQVTNLRIEGSYGFIGYSSDMPNCGNRIWLDMNSVIQRSMYATAMLAMSTGKTVILRALDDGTKVFGACPIYDIYVVQ